MCLAQIRVHIHLCTYTFQSKVLEAEKNENRSKMNNQKRKKEEKIFNAEFDTERLKNAILHRSLKTGV